MGQALIEYLSVNMRALSKQHLIGLSQIGKLTSAVAKLKQTYCPKHRNAFGLSQQSGSPFIH
jgi:hypothetical protein